MQQITAEALGPDSKESRKLIEAAAELRPTIRGYDEQIEREGRLPKELIEQLKAAGLYRMMVPRELGGLQVDPLAYYRAVELTASGAGSAGWNVANCAIGKLVALSVPDEGVREIFDSGPDVILGGTVVAEGGRGVAVEGGYVVNGRWRFGSGCQEAQWMMGTFELREGDQPKRSPDGSAMFRRAFFPVEECSIIDSWDVTGLRGTGSHDWSVSERFVPDRRTAPLLGFPLDNQWSRWPGTLYSLPVQTFIGPHHSSVATGIARGGIDALVELAGGKVRRGRPGLLCDQPHVQDTVARAEAMLEAGRAYRTAAVTDVWQTVAAGRPTTLEQRARCRLAATHAADSALQAIDLMYRAGGTTSIQRNERLARCWRDAHVVGQTVTISPEWYPIIGRVLLGIDPGPRLT